MWAPKIRFYNAGKGYFHSLYLISDSMLFTIKPANQKRYEMS